MVIEFLQRARCWWQPSRPGGQGLCQPLPTSSFIFLSLVSLLLFCFLTFWILFTSGLDGKGGAIVHLPLRTHWPPTFGKLWLGDSKTDLKMDLTFVRDAVVVENTFQYSTQSTLGWWCNQAIMPWRDRVCLVLRTSCPFQKQRGRIHWVNSGWEAGRNKMFHGEC